MNAISYSERRGDQRINVQQTKNRFSSKYTNDNLYGLCVRGFGNFSFRLGETLMMGRIPILIDTECILPFDR